MYIYGRYAPTLCFAIFENFPGRNLPSLARGLAEIRSRLSSRFFRPGVHWVLAKRFTAKVFQDGGRNSTINVQKTWHNIRRGVEESC